MREAMGYVAKAVSDHTHQELLPEEIFSLFKKPSKMWWSLQCEGRSLPADRGRRHRYPGDFQIYGRTITTEAKGNGRLNAVSNALKKAYELKFDLVTYQEHALEQSSSSPRHCLCGIRKPDGSLAWGAGLHSDIIHASIEALVAAINNGSMAQKELWRVSPGLFWPMSPSVR